MNDTLSKARTLLENVTPLLTDCGLLCGHACCSANGDAGESVWLFPEENEFDMPWGEKRQSKMPVTGTPVISLYCHAPCERAKRPFQCMIFPLVPYFSEKKDAWSVRMDRRAYALCPLTGCGKKGLNPEFVKKAELAVRIISGTEAGERFLEALAREEDAYRITL